MASFLPTADNSLGRARSVFEHAMQGSPSAELRLRPFQIAHFGCPQPMPEGDQDQGSVPVTIAAVLGRLHKPLNLGHGKIFPRPQLVVGWTHRN
jgi:hypothetical protein